MRLALQHVMICFVCEQTLDSEAAAAVAVEAKLFGARPFAICPCCGQRPPRDTAAYRRRAREHLAGERPEERPGLSLHARHTTGGFKWVYREAQRAGGGR